MKNKKNISYFLEIPYKLWEYTIRPKLGLPDYSQLKLSETQKLFKKGLSYFKPAKSTTKGVLLVQIVESYDIAIQLAVGGKALADKNNLQINFYNVLIDWIRDKNHKKTFSERATKKKLNEIYLSFGNKIIFDNEKRYPDQVFIQQKLTHIIDTLDKSDRANILTIKFEDILVGDLIYDTYLRFFHKPTLDKIDDEVIHIIEVALNVFYNFKLLLNSNNIKGLLNTYSSYIHHGIPARICLNNNIPVYTIGSYSYLLQELSKDFPYHQVNHTLFSPDRLLNEQQLNEAKEIFTSRFKGKIDSATSYMKQSSFSDKILDPEVKKLFAKENRNIVIYVHDFYDSPHVNRMLQFPDLYQFLKQTLQALIDLKGTSVFIKTHPNGIDGCKEKTIELVNNFACNHFYILDESVTNLHIIDLKPNLIATARGTVCVEMAYFEIPTVALYDNLYANFDFVHTCKNTDSYFAILKGEEQPVIKFDKQKIYSFYYQAFLEKTVKEENNIFNILRAYKGDTFDDEYLKMILSNEDKIFCPKFLEYYKKAI